MNGMFKLKKYLFVSNSVIFSKKTDNSPNTLAKRTEKTGSHDNSDKVHLNTTPTITKFHGILKRSGEKK